MNTRLVAPRKAPFEIRQQHELAGLIALGEKRGEAAVQEFMASNQQDPRILYLTALAWNEAGDARKAAAFAEKAAKFNGLAFSSAYVAGRRKRLLPSSFLLPPSSFFLLPYLKYQ